MFFNFRAIVYKYVFFILIFVFNSRFLSSTSLDLKTCRNFGLKVRVVENQDINREKDILIRFTEGLLYNPIKESIDSAVKIKEKYPYIIESLDKSKLIDILEFLYLTKLSKLNNEFENIDISKSILLGSICNNCNREIVEKSLLWNIYKLAKENKFKSLGRFIKNKVLLSRLKLPEELKDIEISKFL